jgi:hypothetical protein
MSPDLADGLTIHAHTTGLEHFETPNTPIKIFDQNSK